MMITKFHNAVSTGDLALVNEMMDANVNLDLANVMGAGGKTALHVACGEGKVST